jgi:hypothetical protein
MFLAPKNRHHPLQRPSVRTTNLDEEEKMAIGGASATSASNAQQHSANENAKKEAEHQLVTTTWLLRICKFLNVVTGAAALLGIVTNASLLSVPSPAPVVAMRLYGIALCLLSLLTEFEWVRVFSWLAVQETWIGRGLNNILCAILILVVDASSSGNEGKAEGDSDRTWLLCQLAGNFLLAMGSIYTISGLLCLQRIKNQHLSKIRKRDQALMQKQELETRKHEIELLLKDTESQLEKI